MKLRIQNRFLLSALACIGLAAPSAFAATYYWDNNGATAGFGTAAGTWAAPTTGNATQGWSTNTGGTATPGNITTLSTNATTDAVNFGNNTTGLAAGTITVSGTVQAGNITFASGSGAIVLSGGTINLTNAATGPTITVNNSSDTIGSNLTGGLGGATPSTISKAGTGTLILSGTNTYAGTTSIGAGVLRLDSASALPGGIGSTGGTGGLTFNGGALGLGSGDFSRPYNATQGVAGAFSVPSNTGAWWAAYGADRVVNVGGANGSQQWFNGKPITVGDSTSTHKVRISNPFNFTPSMRPLVAIDGAADIDGELSGVVSCSTPTSPGAGLDKSGNGTVALTGSSTFAGMILIRQGTVVVNRVTDSLAAGPLGAGTYGATLAGGTLKYAPVPNTPGGELGAGHSTNRNFTLTASSTIDASGTGALSFTNVGILSPDVSLSGTTTAASAVITGLSSTADLAVGMTVSMAGVPAGRTIASINSANQITLNSGTSVTAGTNSISIGTPTARTLTLTGTNTAANTIAGILQDSSATGAGVLSLTKANTGSWTLSGANTFSGNITVNAGTLIGAGATNSPGISAFGNRSNTRTITVNAGGTLQFNSGNILGTNHTAITAATLIINSGGVVTNGSIATNNALNNVQLNSGTLTSTTGHTGSSSPFTPVYGAWNLNGSVTSTGTSTISTSDSTKGWIMLKVVDDKTTSFNVTNGTLTVSAPVVDNPTDSNIGSLSKSGAGAMILSAANTYTGSTSISAGSLSVASTGSLANTAISATGTGIFSVTPGSGAVTLGNTSTAAAGATLNLASGTTFSMLDGTAGGTTNLVQEATFASPALTLDTASLSFELSGTSADKLAVTGSASLTGVNSINVLPVGPLTAGTYDLITTASGLDTGGTFVFGSTGTTTQTVAFGTEAYTLSLNNAAGVESVTVGTPISISGVTWAGQTNGNGAADSTWSNGANSNWAAGPSAIAFTNGTAVTFGDTNAANGDLAITNSTVTVATGGVIPTSTTFDNTAVNYTVGGAAIGGSGGITKLGSGSLTLSSANSYSGVTTIDAGTIILGNAAALGAGTGAPDGTTISSGATLDLGGVSNGANSAAGSERITVSGTGVGGNGAITSTSTISTPFVGVRYLTLAADTTLAFPSRWDIGTSTAANNGFVGGGYNLTFLGAGTGDCSLNFLGETDLGDILVNLGAKILYLQGDTTLGQTGKTVTVSGGSTLDWFTNVTLTNYDKNFALDNGTLKFDRTATTFTLPGTITLTNSNTVNTAGGSTTAVTASGVISGTGSLTKSGAGTLTLSNANDYTGSTISNAGTLSLTGSLTGSNVSTSGTGVISQSATGVIAGTGVTFSHGSSGTSTLAGANTYTGDTTLSAGVVAISNASSFSSGNVVVTGASRINAAGGITYANNIDVGTQTLTMQNPATGANSTATFSGVLSGSGTLSLPNSGSNGIQGILAFTNTANTFTGDVVLAASGSGDEHFQFNSIGDGGNLTFAKNGNRQLMTYSGSTDTTFEARRINIASTMTNITTRQGLDGGGGNPVSSFFSSGGGAVTFNSNMGMTSLASDGVFYFNGTNTGSNTYAGVIADPTGTGRLWIGKLGVGTWVLTGDNTFEGGTIVANGVLSVAKIENASVAQPLGQGSVIQFGVGNGGTSGSLIFTGATDSTTDKQVVIGAMNQGNSTAAGSILNNGSGTLTFSNANFNPTISGNAVSGITTNAATVGRTLTLGGSNAGANVISGIIQNNNGATGTVALTVSGSSWTLSGVNIYSGATTVTGGTLVLGNSSALGTSAASVTGGSLNLNGQAVANAVSVGTLGTLTGAGSTGAATLAGSVTPGGTGNGVITMVSATVASTSSITLQLPGTGTRGTDYDGITISGALALDGTITIDITGLTPAAGQTFDIIDSTGAIGVTNFTVATDLILPALSGGLAWDTSTFATDGVISIVNADPFIAWAASKGLTSGNNAKGDDPDNDGRNNLFEFAFDGSPLSGANDGKIVGKIGTVGADQVMTLTLPVRTGATFSPTGGDQLSALIDALYYKIEGDVDLGTFANTISEVTGGDATAIQTGLPTLSTGWTYRTFRDAGTVPTVPKVFLRAKISETP